MGSVSWAAKYKMAPTQAYKISKAALHMLNAQYALDHEDAGFTFLCVSPGVGCHSKYRIMNQD
jgi:NAD(P)-dependent dehydrogenase (short-subunit alcohol dehydrogenase family)